MMIIEEPDAKNPQEELEVLPPSAVESLVRGEIDVQIATAHKYPRSVALFKKRAREMISMDEETAASCIYSRPVGKEKGVMKYAEGMSVRLAEIVGACYGNLRTGCSLIDMTPRYVTARGMAHDLETNNAVSLEVVEPTVTKEGQPYSAPMRILISKAALAKARRDATFVVVPRALCKPLLELARQIAVGDATTLAKRRAAVMGWIGKLGIDIERVYAALGIKGEEDIGIDQLTTLTGLKTSIKDGDVTVDEAFPLPGVATARAAKPDWGKLEKPPVGIEHLGHGPAAAQAPPEPTPPPSPLPSKQARGRQRSEPVPPPAVKEPAGATSKAKDLLYNEIPDKESRADFLDALRRINYPGVRTAAGFGLQFDELPEDVCENIMRDGVEELWAKARAQAAIDDERDEFFPLDPRTHGIQED